MKGRSKWWEYEIAKGVRMSRSSTPNFNNDAGEEGMFLISGVLTELHVEQGRDRLVASIEARLKANAITGTLATAAEIFGQAASAVALTYDNEETQNFACLIKEHVVFGQFAGAEKLEVGTSVKAVVSKRGDVLYAHALMSEKGPTIWTHFTKGAKAERNSNLRIGIYSTLFATFCATVSDFMLGPDTGMRFNNFLYYLGGSLLICTVVGGWSNITMQGVAGPATEVFRLLGFIEPERINLVPYQYFAVHYHDMDRSQATSQYMNVYCIGEAIERGELRFVKNINAPR